MTVKSRTVLITGSFFIILPALIMFYNTFSHPPANSYDYSAHIASIKENQYLLQPIPQKLKYQLEYNPPLYYYILGKTNHIIEEILRKEIDPFYFARLLHLAALVTIAYLYLKLIPAITKRRSLKNWSIIAFFTIPNVYLSQVMVRADHLLFFSLNLLFFTWFKYDFPKKLAYSTKRQLIWASSLVIMANSRNFAIFAFALFFIWGAVILIKSLLTINSKASAKFYTILLLIVIIVGSGHFYLQRYLSNGLIFDQPRDTSYFEKFYQRQKNFDRRILFFNFQFDELFKRPNRNARFKNGNAFLPRFYGDMWADHWLYFSGSLMEDKKIIFKQIVLVLAIPFTIFYFLTPVIFFVKAIKLLISKQKLQIEHVASVLFCTALVLLVTFVFRQPEVGKNGSIKFIYLMAFVWFPVLPIVKFLDSHKILSKLLFYYNILLFFFALPLYIYWK